MVRGVVASCVMAAMVAAGAASCGSSSKATTAEGESVQGADTLTKQLDEALLERGGQLYDTWWVVADLPEPEGDHPFWSRQQTNTRTGPVTWRCKECHGWDYMGYQGAYKPGSSHHTGFPGVYNARTISDAMLTTSLTRPGHDFSQVGDENMAALVAFIQTGLVDVTPYIAPDTKRILGGDIEHGGVLFRNTCAACHGPQGQKMDLGHEKQPQYLGHVARDNPWEFIHKVRFGQPGTTMPAAVNKGWDMNAIRDVAAYAQTLP